MEKTIAELIADLSADETYIRRKAINRPGELRAKQAVYPPVNGEMKTDGNSVRVKHS